MSIEKIPMSVWIGAVSVLVVLVGSYFNVWRVVGVKDSFPYLEISKPLPELNEVEPASTVVGESVVLSGARFEAFNPQSSRVVIGSVPAEVTNWRRKPGRITVRVPQLLVPGRYPVSVQIGDRQSKGDVHLDIRLLPEDLAEQVANGERILVLVALLANSESPIALQTELVERMSSHIASDKRLYENLLIAPWPEAITGNVADRLKQISESNNARLIVFGRAGSGENFFPRIYADPPAREIFRPSEQQLTPASLTQFGATMLDTYDLTPRPVREPLRMVRFLLALSRYQMGDLEGARELLEELIGEEGVTAVDKGTLLLALGRVTALIGSTILEKPLRTEDDHRKGQALLQKAIEHLTQAAEELSKNPERRYQVAEVYLALGAASASMPFGDLGNKHKQALQHLKEALKYLNCDREFLRCLIAYDNLGSSNEWLASTHWDRGKADDLLEQSIAFGQKALEMHAARVRENETLSEQERISPNLLAWEHAWLRNQIGIAKGHLYRDRDRNLKEAVSLSEEALPIFLTQGDKLAGRIALTYNHIATSLINQEGDRAALLRQAEEALDKGLAYVGPNMFPEFHGMLTRNKEDLKRLVAQGNKLTHNEVAKRLEAEFYRSYRAGQFARAEKQALAYLNWCWREFGEPSRYTAIAHALLARVAGQSGDPDLAFAHTVSARTVLSRFETQDAAGIRLMQDLDRDLSEFVRINRYKRGGVVQLVRSVSQGYSYLLEHRRKGDRLLESDPHDAIQYYDAALALYPYHPLILVNRSSAKLRAGDFNGYASDLSNALLIYPDDPKALYNRALLYADTGRWQEALDDLGAAIGAGGDEADFFILRAQVYEKLEEVEKALVDYREAVRRVRTDERKEDLARVIAELEGKENIMNRR